MHLYGLSKLIQYTHFSSNLGYLSLLCIWDKAIYSELPGYTENVFESTEDNIQICYLFFFPQINCLTKVATYIAAAMLLQRRTALSLLCKPVPLVDSSSDLGQHLLTGPGSTELCRHFYYTQYGYFSKGVCSSPNPDILHPSSALCRQKHWEKAVSEVIAKR